MIKPQIEILIDVLFFLIWCALGFTASTSPQACMLGVLGGMKISHALVLYSKSQNKKRKKVKWKK